MSTTRPRRALSSSNINPNLLKAQYAVRGEIASRSEAYRHQLQDNIRTDQNTDSHSAPLPLTPPPSAGEMHKKKSALPFDEVISANIGNPQQLDQKPITFFRQVLSILEYPELLKHEDLFPEDVRERAQFLLKAVHSVGAYSQSQGVWEIREAVARFITERDGFPSDPNKIFLSAGASSGVNTLLSTICTGHPHSGILIPIPQYPLYTATLALLNATPLPYYLSEPASWSTNVPEISDTIADARASGTDPRCIVIINPGNPTGACLDIDKIREVIQLAAKEHLVVMADEVYQTNVYKGEFHSFKKVLCMMQQEEPGRYDKVELVSLHSISKGMVGECGHRGGYFELYNFDPEVAAQIYKLVSITLCAPVVGQCLVELMVNPPRVGSASFPLYDSEYSAIFSGLKSRSQDLYKAFNAMEAVSCQDPEGAMYLFPRILLPKKAIDAARREGRKPDEFYCLRLLDRTGICVVPGSGFGQREGEWHFRTTFLPPGTEWVGRWRDMHKEFMEEFRD